MFEKMKKDANTNNNINNDTSETNNFILSSSLESNIQTLKEIFSDNDTFIVRFIENQTNSKIRGSLLFYDGLVNKDIINECVIKPLVQNTDIKCDSELIDNIKNKVIITDNIEKTTDINRLIDAVYSGEVVLLLDSCTDALIINSKDGESRAISEPETEKVLRGPREGFTESLITNLSLIQRKLKTPKLKLKIRVMGKETHTKICICYIKGIANEKVLQELNKRLDDIEIDGILDSGYIQELVRDSPYVPFKTVGSTERPDVVTAKLLEGRIAVIVDGSPVALTVPFIFIEYFQNSDDYYMNFHFSSISRLIRILGFIMTISIPAIYTAFITYHMDIIPTPLLFSISTSREGVPFPTIIEALIMLLIFETLRETGLRTPAFMGQAINTAGALVIGTAAVDAKFVSAPMVIIIAFTGITGLLMPKLKGAVLLVRLIFLFLAGFLGLYGYVFGIACLLIHLFELKSFGVPYMYKLMLLDPKEDIKDTLIRAPWWYHKFRPGLIAVQRIRQNTKRGGKG